MNNKDDNDVIILPTGEPEPRQPKPEPEPKDDKKG